MQCSAMVLCGQKPSTTMKGAGRRSRSFVSRLCQLPDRVANRRSIQPLSSAFGCLGLSPRSGTSRRVVWEKQRKLANHIEGVGMKYHPWG